MMRILMVVKIRTKHLLKVGSALIKLGYEQSSLPFYTELHGQDNHNEPTQDESCPIAGSFTAIS